MDKTHFTFSLLRFVGFTLFIVLLWHVALSFLISVEQDKNTQLKLMLTKKHTDIVGFEQREQKKAKFESELNFIVGLRKKNQKVEYLLYDLAALMPADIVLQRLERRDKMLTLSGNAASNLALAELAKQVEGSALFERSTLTQMAAGNFQLKMWMK